MGKRLQRIYGHTPWYRCSKQWTAATCNWNKMQKQLVSQRFFVAMHLPTCFSKHISWPWIPKTYLCTGCNLLGTSAPHCATWGSTFLQVVVHDGCGTAVQAWWKLVVVLHEAALFRRFIDDLIWVATSQLSNESIRQSLSSAFANSGLELMFCQACTANQKDEVEFLDVNHCITTDNDFSFVTKDFVKPTAERKQFTNSESHHPKSTFKSILFREAMRLRRLSHLNQRKEDNLSSLNWIKEKAIRSKFPLAMTNDMIAMASNQEERLCSQMLQERWSPGLDYIFPWPDNSNREKKILNPNAMITYKRPTTIGQMLRAKFKQDERACQRCVRSLQPLCGHHGKHNKSMVPCVSQIIGKNNTFPLNQNLTCTNYGIYVATCVICQEQYVSETKNKFSKRWSLHYSNWNRPNCEIDENNKDRSALSWHYSVFHSNVNKTLIHGAYTVTFVEQPNFLSLNFCEDKWPSNHACWWRLTGSGRGVEQGHGNIRWIPPD